MDAKELPVQAALPEEVWSDNREDFNYDSLAELLDSNAVEVGQLVFVGEKTPVDAARYIDVGIFLDALGDLAYEHMGDVASDYPDVTQEAHEELEALLSAWVQKHARPTFYAVKNIRPYTIMQQDFGE